MDQSASALDMITHFVYGLPLTTTSQEDTGTIDKDSRPQSPSNIARPLRVGMAEDETAQSTILTSAS